MELSRYELDRIREVSGIAGISYETLLNNDMRFYRSVITGFHRRREIELNDSIQAGIIIAGKIGMAVNGDNRGFNKPVKYIELVKPTPIERKIKMQEQLKNLLEGGLI